MLPLPGWPLSLSTQSHSLSSPSTVPLLRDSDAAWQHLCQAGSECLYYIWLDSDSETGGVPSDIFKFSDYVTTPTGLALTRPRAGGIRLRASPWAAAPLSYRRAVTVPVTRDY